MSDFGSALVALKNGQRVCRAGWKGKGMWLSLIKAENYIVSAVGMVMSGPGKMAMPADETRDLLPWIGMKTADDKFVPWLASQTDILADDWGVVE